MLGFKLCLVCCDRSSGRWVSQGGGGFGGFIHWRERYGCDTSMVIAGWNGRVWLGMGSICGLIDAICYMFFLGRSGEHGGQVVSVV